MADEKDDIEGKDKPADPSPANDPAADPNKDPADGADKGDGGDGGDKPIMVPKHRLDEETDKRKALEAEVAEMNGRMSRMGEALIGKDAEVVDEEVRGLSKKYGVSEDFIKDTMDLAEKRAAKRMGAEVAPLKKSQAELGFERELNTLYDTHEDARDLSADDKKKLREMAFDPKYSRTPLEDIYKIVSHGRPVGKRRSFEAGRGGATRAGDGEVDISKMSPDEFQAYSDKLAAGGE